MGASVLDRMGMPDLPTFPTSVPVTPPRLSYAPPATQGETSFRTITIFAERRPLKCGSLAAGGRDKVGRHRHVAPDIDTRVREVTPPAQNLNHGHISICDSTEFLNPFSSLPARFRMLLLSCQSPP